ncbi:MAG: autotransporter strand-loop-strand O-heptosyltransferase [Negativicutes bacterium]|nr:autotransporter strand-loop-strand O-heptosyltransferase [Negativicutes bacterium]
MSDMQTETQDRNQTQSQTQTEVKGGPAGDQAGKKPYFVIDPGPLTCKTDIEGLAFDFNYGVRVKVPEGDWRVKFTDRDAGVTLYDARASNAFVTSTKKYYINFGLEVYLADKLIFSHDFSPTGKRILLKFPSGTLGDVLAWFPYAQVFKHNHDCEVYVAMADNLTELFAPTYPELHFVGSDERPPDIYATYYMGIFFPSSDRVHQPVDFRITGLQKTIPCLLGLEAKEVRPRIAPQNLERAIEQPYVCIASQSTTQAKYWNNPTGWLSTIKHLKEKGYRVLCIDQKICHGAGSRWNTIPYGAEDFTGDRPLQERVDLLYHADFFVGLSSGLSWLAWAAGKPIVLVSGFTLPMNEFYTPYRVINYHVCNGCWNDGAIEFVHDDFEWCPRHKHTDRQYECSRFITPENVNRVIDRLMTDHGFKPKRKG